VSSVCLNQILNIKDEWQHIHGRDGTITGSMNGNISMDGTITGSMNGNIPMDGAITGSMNAYY
jgi:hypothetical protein